MIRCANLLPALPHCVTRRASFALPANTCGMQGPSVGSLSAEWQRVDLRVPAMPRPKSMRITIVTTLNLVAATLVAGCSSSGTNDATASACERFYEAYVGATKACSGIAPTASARANFVKSCLNTATAPGSRAGVAFLDGCAQALGVPSVCSALSEVEGCQLPAGTLPDGEACGDNAQCASGACKGGASSPSLSRDGGAAPAYCGVCIATGREGGECVAGVLCSPGLRCTGGRCTKPTRVADGAACTTSIGGDIGCNVGSYCASQDVNGQSERRCAKYPLKGEDCTSSTCVAGLVCLAGKCADRVEAGGACPNRTECNVNLSCTSEVCVAPSIVQVDQPCGALNPPGAAANFANCAAGLSCVFSTSNSVGTCRPNVPEGGACSSSRAAASCDAYLLCIGGTCQFKDASICR